MLATALVYALAFVVRAFRWSKLIEPLKKIPAFKLFSYLILGFFMNSLLPLRLGEFIRAHVAGQKTGLPRSGMLATVLVERLFDGLSYVTLFLVVIQFLPFPELAKKSMLAASVIFIGAMIFLFFFVAHRDKAEIFFRKIPIPVKFRDRAHKIFVNFLDGLTIFSHKSGLIRGFALSLVVWTIEGTAFFVLGTAFNLNLNILQCVLVMIVIGTGSIIPTAPGYVGTVEFLGVTSLTFLGIDKNLAFGYIITLHFLQLATISILGIHAMIKEKLTLSELVRIHK